MTEPIDPALEIIELREELQRTKLLLQNCNGDIVRADRELASLREQLKQREEVIRELIPIAQERFEIAVDVVKCWVDDDKPYAEQKLKRMKAIIEKAKSLTTKGK